MKFGGGNVVVRDSEVYVSILNKNLLASTRKLRMGKYFIFQQDNDPKHTLKKAKEVFIQKQIELLECPAQSTDFNPIQHLWAILDQKAGAQCLKEKEQLKILV